jgi:hypothetical protein
MGDQVDKLCKTQKNMGVVAIHYFLLILHNIIIDMKNATIQL